MTPERLALDEETVDGQVARQVAWLDDGTVEFYEHGELVESRQQTEVEAARFAPDPQTDVDRLAALEAQNAALVAALAKATTLAQVRAAAQAAAT